VNLTRPRWAISAFFAVLLAVTVVAAPHGAAFQAEAIRSYTSEKDGRFRFAQVNMSDDYDLWAEKDNRKTAMKTVSSWDARKEFETELKFK